MMASKGCLIDMLLMLVLFFARSNALQGAPTGMGLIDANVSIGFQLLATA